MEEKLWNNFVFRRVPDLHRNYIVSFAREQLNRIPMVNFSVNENTYKISKTEEMIKYYHCVYHEWIVPFLFILLIW